MAYIKQIVLKSLQRFATSWRLSFFHQIYGYSAQTNSVKQHNSQNIMTKIAGRQCKPKQDRLVSQGAL